MVASFAIIHRADYYTRDSNNYYLSDREPNGRWLTGSERLGIDAGTDVEANIFENLSAGIDRNGQTLIKYAGAGRHTAGVDLTFSCPKGVSVLWALGDDNLRRAIEAAESEAVAATVAFLQQELPLGRRGRNGIRREHVHLVAAAFSHGEARPERHADGVVAPDPQRHTHVTILNVAERADGSFGAIDTVQLRQWKKALGVHFRVGLATRLQRAGFALGPVSADGLFDVAGVPSEVTAYFSARRATIEEQLAAAGTTSTAAPALAAHLTQTTRRNKETRPEGDRHQRWQAATRQLGYEPESIIQTARNLGMDAQSSIATAAERIAERLAQVPDLLTATQSVFERHRLFEAVGAVLVGGSVQPDRIKVEVDRLLADGSIVELGRDRTGAPRYSTPEMIAIERALVDAAGRLAFDVRRGPASKVVAREACTAGLTNEQRAAVDLATSGARLAVILGTAGTGKSHTLAVVARAWEAANHRVLGASIAWKAANTLGNDLAIPSRSINSWLAKIETGSAVLDSSTLLIVDEAGLMSSRQMQRLLAHVENARASILLVGDSRQLQPIGPGAALRLVNDTVAGVRLDTIVRQQHEWARDAVHAFARGDAGAGLSAYSSRGLLVEADGGAAAVTALVDAWEATRRTSPETSILAVAKTNTEVRAICNTIRSRLRAEGTLDNGDISIRAVTPSGQGYDLPLAIGDRVRFLHRFDQFKVVNGTEAEVTGIATSRDGAVTIKTRIDQREIRFTAADIADEQGRSLIAHAWASTIFQAQGATVDRVFVLGSGKFDRHDAYVAMSRARQEAKLFIDQRALDIEIRANDPDHNITIDQDRRLAHLANCLSRENPKYSTLDPLVHVAGEIPLQPDHSSVPKHELAQELS
ncbi:Conjugal transfer relaxase TraA OS=Afipia felis OX=1035 GN=NCTC12722_02394 PE=4 SV=1 [Afipia felis]